MDNASSSQPRPLQMGAKGAYIVRLLMVGDSACGKTSLVLRFDQNVFSTKFVTTIGVDYRDKMVKVSTHMFTVPITLSSLFLPTVSLGRMRGVRSKAHPCDFNSGILRAKNGFEV